MEARIRRRIPVENNLYFEYEVSPHRAILARISEVSANDLSGVISSPQSLGESPAPRSNPLRRARKEWIASSLPRRVSTEDYSSVLPMASLTDLWNSDCALPTNTTKVPVGMLIPFKQVRLKGQINPLKPPLHVETVLEPVLS